MKKAITYVNFLMRPPTQYEREVCAYCRFSVGPNDNKICDYLSNHQIEHRNAESHRRPCKYNECVKCGVWEPKKRISEARITAIREKYKNGNIL